MEKSVINRDSEKDRDSSLILFDPPFVAMPSNEPISEEEVHQLQEKHNIHIEDQMPINSGSFALIYRASEIENRREFAIAVKKSHAFRQSWAELEALKLFGDESKCGHINIVKFFGYANFGNRMYLFIQFSALGDLAEYLMNAYEEKDITEKEIYEIFSQVLDGLKHMHQNGYAHRDLKLMNILLFPNDLNSSYDILYKLCDFGSARGDLRLKDGKIKSLSALVGTPSLMAPEMCLGSYNAFRTDTYSLGVILYQLSHSGRYPFNVSAKASNDKDFHRIEEVKELYELKRNKSNLKIDSSLSNGLKELLIKMIDPNPETRVDLKDIYSVNWFINNKN